MPVYFSTAIGTTGLALPAIVAGAQRDTAVKSLMANVPSTFLTIDCQVVTMSVLMTGALSKPAARQSSMECSP